MADTVKDILARRAEGHAATMEAALADLTTTTELVDGLVQAAWEEKGNDGWTLVRSALFSKGPGGIPSIATEVKGTLARIGRSFPDHRRPGDCHLNQVQAWRCVLMDVHGYLARDVEALDRAPVHAGPR